VQYNAVLWCISLANHCCGGNATMQCVCCWTTCVCQ